MKLLQIRNLPLSQRFTKLNIMRKLGFDDFLVLGVIVVAIVFSLGLSFSVIYDVSNNGVNRINIKWLVLVAAFWIMIVKLTILLIRGK